jgi:hypothetical protein
MKHRAASPRFVIAQVPGYNGNLCTPAGQAAGYSSSRESGINTHPEIVLYLLPRWNLFGAPTAIGSGFESQSNPEKTSSQMRKIRGLSSSRVIMRNPPPDPANHALDPRATPRRKLSGGPR